MRLLVFAAAVPAVLRAQSTSFTIDAGSSSMRFADSLSASALNISPALRLTSSRGSLGAYGVLSSMSGASISAGTLDGSLNTVPRGPLSFELEGIAGGSSHSDGTRTAQVIALGRAHLDGSAGGLWIGGGAGRTTDGVWRSVIRGEAGAWLGEVQSNAGLSLIPTVVDDTIKYTDMNVTAHRDANAWELDGALGFRTGDQLPLPANNRVWGSAAATYWFAPQFAVVASAGTYPVDFTQGFPGGRFLSLNLRWRANGGAASPASIAAGVTRFTVTGSGDSRTLIVDAPNARNIEVSGDFTQWNPVPMVSNGRGRFAITLPIAAGTYEMNLRVDGGPWLVPPGLTSIRDEFGGQSGVLVVR